MLFDRALKQTRRAALREQGLVPRPLPQIRIVRWLRAPRETYKAWSLMLLEGVRSLDEAVEEVREDQRQKEETRLRRREQQRVERAQLKAISRGHRGPFPRSGPRTAGRGSGGGARRLGTRLRGACHIGAGTAAGARTALPAARAQEH